MSAPRDLSRWFPFLSWPRPDAALLRGEIGAGLTVALVMIPQSVAYAALALREAGVRLLPGEHFGPSGAGFVRLSLGVPTPRLLEAIGRLARCL